MLLKWFSFEWSHPRISSTDLKVKLTTDLGITSSRHERVKESPFPLLLPPCLIGDRVTESSFPLPPTPPSYGWQGYGIFFPPPLLPPVLCVTGLRNLQFLFLLPPVLCPPHWSHILVSSILWPQADHPNRSRNGDVTCDMWSHTLTVFFNGCSRLCFIKHFSRSLESSREGISRVARDITMPRTVWMVRLCSDIHSGNTDTHFPKKNHHTAVVKSPICVSLLQLFS